MAVREAALLAAMRDVMLMLAAFAVIAGVAASLRDGKSGAAAAVTD